MKIVHLRASNFYGGPERQLHFHARRAAGSPYEVTLASFTENGAAPEFLEVIAKDGLRTHLFEVRSSYELSAVGRIRRYLISEDTDLLCTHDYRSAVLGALAVRGTAARWVAFSRGFTNDDLKVRLFHAIDKIVVRFADHVVAVSKSQERKLARLLVPASKMSVVPNAIDTNFFAGIGSVDLRARFGWPDEAIVVLSGGRFSHEKGQIHLIRAAALALAQQPLLRFALFGEGPDLHFLRQELQSLGIGDAVLLPGFERDLLACLRGADLLVNPSLSEGLPNIVLEAMALGVPVVATAVGGLPEIIEDGRTGRLVRAADPRALSEAILALTGDRDAAGTLARSARQFVQSECTFERQFERLAEVYRRVGPVL